MTQRVAARRVVARLRQDIAALEGRVPGFGSGGLAGGDGAHVPSRSCPDDILATGAAGLDQRLGGGLPLAGLCEFQAGAVRDAGAATGFAACVAAMASARFAARPVLWIVPRLMRSEAGLLHGGGLSALGLHRSALRLVMPQRLEDALWVCEEAARCEGLSAVIFDMRGHSAKLGLTQTRRLHVRAQASGHPVFLLRHVAESEASAAPLRLMVAPAPSAPDRVLTGTAAARIVTGGIGPPGFRITIDKNRAGPAGSVHHVFWNSHDRHFTSAQSQSPASQSGFADRQGVGGGNKGTGRV